MSQAVFWLGPLNSWTKKITLFPTMLNYSVKVTTKFFLSFSFTMQCTWLGAFFRLRLPLLLTVCDGLESAPIDSLIQYSRVLHTHIMHLHQNVNVNLSNSSCHFSLC